LYLPWLNDKDFETFGHDGKGKQTETPIESTGIRSLDEEILFLLLCWGPKEDKHRL
jgi:hypothetical protein